MKRGRLCGVDERFVNWFGPQIDSFSKVLFSLLLICFSLRFLLSHPYTSLKNIRTWLCNKIEKARGAMKDSFFYEAITELGRSRAIVYVRNDDDGQKKKEKKHFSKTETNFLHWVMTSIPMI